MQPNKMSHYSLVCRRISGSEYNAGARTTDRRGLLMVLLIMASGLFGLNRDAHAQLGDIKSAAELVSWSASLSPSVIGPGATTRLVLDVELEGDWKMYALDSSLPLRQIGVPRPFGVTIKWPTLPDGVQLIEPLVQTVPKEAADVQLI